MRALQWFFDQSCAVTNIKEIGLFDIEFSTVDLLEIIHHKRHEKRNEKHRAKSNTGGAALRLDVGHGTFG